MSDDDLNYFEGRAQTELEMAQRSELPQVSAVHYKLAEAYLERVKALEISAAGDLGGLGAEASPEAATAPQSERRTSGRLRRLDEQ